MSFFLLKTDYKQALDTLSQSPWYCACLCAAWCGACRGYKETFSLLSQEFPDMTFVWIDIEDHADLLDEIDIENFPYLLIGYQEYVSFFGCIHPDIKVAQRLITHNKNQSINALITNSKSNAEHISWQQANLKQLIRVHLGLIPNR